MTRIITKDEYPTFQKSVEALTNPVGSALRSINDALGKTLTERRAERLPFYTAHMEYRDGITTALYEGKVARFTGETMDRCPYSRGNVKFNWWREGWAEADEEMQSLTADEVRDLIHDITADYLTEPDLWDGDPYDGPDTLEEAR